MRQEERLFQAIGAADPSLVAHSDWRKARTVSPWGRWALSAAACLAVLVVAGGLFVISSWRVGSAAPASSKPMASAGTPAASTPAAPAPAASAPAAAEPSPSASGDSVVNGDGGLSNEGGFPAGSIHLTQLGAGTASPAFLLHLDPAYTLSEKDGKWWLNPVEPPEGNLPWCGMTIEHRPGVSPETAAEAAAGELRPSDFEEVSDIEEDGGVLSFHASYGTDWDDAQLDVRAVDDRDGGCYVLTGHYYLEAAEGHGVRFANMAATFQPVTEDIPDWLIDLRATADAVSEAVFAGDLTPVQDRVAEGAGSEGEGLVGGGLEGVSVSSIDLSVDDAGNPSTAVASVRFRHLEDSYDYLTMELRLESVGWIVTFMGLEK